MSRFVILGLVLAFTNAFADGKAYKTQKSAFDGFYVSAGIGDASGRLNFDDSGTYISNVNDPTRLTHDFLQSQTLQQKSVLGYFNLGYGKLFSKQLYLSLFAYLDIASHKFNNHLTAESDDLGAGASDEIFNYTSSAKLGNVSGGLALQPGWLLTPKTLFFGVIGWQNAKEFISGSQTLEEGRIPDTILASGSVSSTKSKTINGLRLGLGFEQQIKESLMLGLRYVYTFYYNAPSVTSPTATAPGILPGEFFHTLGKQKINTQAILANVSYYLGEPSTFDGESNIAANDFNGRFFALRLGAVNPSISDNPIMTARYTDNFGEDESIQISNTKPNDTAMALFNFTIGYGQVYKNRYYLGLEGFVETSDNTIDTQLEQGFRPTTIARGQLADTVSQNTKIKLWNPQPGGDIKIGVILYNRILNFFKVGLVLNKVKGTISDQLSYLDNSNPDVRTNLNLNVNSNNSVKASLRLGAGFDFQFSPHNAFSLEYDYTDYGRVGITGSTSAIDAAGNNATLTQSGNLKLATNYVTIGYIHFFE